MIFATKVAIVARDDLQVWQKLDVAAFLTSAIVGTASDPMGEPYRDAAGNFYLSPLVQPVIAHERKLVDKITKGARMHP